MVWFKIDIDINIRYYCMVLNTQAVSVAVKIAKQIQISTDTSLAGNPVPLFGMTAFLRLSL